MFINSIKYSKIPCIEESDQLSDGNGGCHPEVIGMISAQVQKVHRFASSFKKLIGSGAEYTTSSVQQAADKVEQFLYRNKETIFYVGCSVATAYFSPHLFGCSAAAMVIGRIELNRKLRNFADEYIKDEKNPYKQNSLYTSYITPLEITMGAAAAANALALSALVITNPFSTIVMPMMGGAAVGSGIAKAGMNLTNYLKS